MHELTIARPLFMEILESARSKGLDRISSVKIALGEAFGIDAELLKHSFMDHLFPNSIAEDCKVDICTESLTARCNQCHSSIVELSQEGKCPKCDASDLDITGGMKAILLDVA